MIKPRNTKVLIKRRETETKTSAGIYLATSSQVKYAEGEVLAVGNLVEDLKPGDYVIFDKFATYQDIDNSILIDEQDILAVKINSN